MHIPLLFDCKLGYKKLLMFYTEILYVIPNWINKVNKVNKFKQFSID
jgi:hypothetical protein